jgi:hypothetical protein
MASSPAHAPFVFERFGTTHHLKLDGADGLEQILRLDPSLWIALSAPVASLHTDSAFLDYVDDDRDGRIRSAELRRAIEWSFLLLKNRDGLSGGSDSVRAGDISAETEEGVAAADAAGKVAALRESDDGAPVTLAEVRKALAGKAVTDSLELEVLLPEETDDPGLRAFLDDIVKSLGGRERADGRSGVDLAGVDAFIEAAAARAEWLGDLHEAGDEVASARMPFADTPALFATLGAVEEKVAEYFVQCRAAAVDLTLSEPSDETVDELSPTDVSGLQAAVSAAPLMAPSAARELLREGPINPVWEDAVHALFDGPVEACLGERDRLDETAWEAVCARFASHRAWATSDPAPKLSLLGVESLSRASDPSLRESMVTLLEQRRTATLSASSLRLLEKLLLFQWLLLRLANNFVSFPDLYEVDRRALFDLGTLLLDGRQFQLAVLVRDRKMHAAVTRSSKICVIYARVTGAGVEPYEIAAAVTNGGLGNIGVGKRGVFEDLAGRLLDAQIVEIIDNPISFSEAFSAPFKRLGAAVTGKIEAITASAESRVDAVGVGLVDDVTEAATAEVVPVAPAVGGAGLVAGGGLAVAALGSSVAFITKTLSSMTAMDMLTGLGAAVFGLIVPAVVLAVIKLRRRDLSPLLEGCGWAVNGRMRLTRRQCRYFTQTPEFPPGSKGVLRPSGAWVWALLVLVVIVAAWSYRGM